MQTNNQKMKIGDTIYFVRSDSPQGLYKISDKKITAISRDGHPICGQRSHFPSEYYLTEESAAKVALLLTSENLENLVEQQSELEVKIKEATDSLKNFQDYLDSCCAAPDNAQSNSNQ